MAGIHTASSFAAPSKELTWKLRFERGLSHSPTLTVSKTSEGLQVQEGAHTEIYQKSVCSQIAWKKLFESVTVASELGVSKSCRPGNPEIGKIRVTSSRHSRALLPWCQEDRLQPRAWAQEIRRCRAP